MSLFIYSVGISIIYTMVHWLIFYFIRPRLFMKTTIILLLIHTLLLSISLVFYIEMNLLDLISILLPFLFFWIGHTLLLVNIQNSLSLHVFSLIEERGHITAAEASNEFLNETALINRINDLYKNGFLDTPDATNPILTPKGLLYARITIYLHKILGITECG